MRLRLLGSSSFCCFRGSLTEIEADNDANEFDIHSEKCLVENNLLKFLAFIFYLLVS
jgi:hypothetical protein